MSVRAESYVEELFEDLLDDLVDGDPTRAVFVRAMLVEVAWNRVLWREMAALTGLAGAKA